MSARRNLSLANPDKIWYQGSISASAIQTHFFLYRCSKIPSSFKLSDSNQGFLTYFKFFCVIWEKSINLCLFLMCWIWLPHVCRWAFGTVWKSTLRLVKLLSALFILCYKEKSEPTSLATVSLWNSFEACSLNMHIIMNHDNFSENLLILMFSFFITIMMNLITPR